MSLTIYVPYDNADQTPVFAHGQERVDFRSDASAADRCTVAFAAEELRNHLEAMGWTVRVRSTAGEKRRTVEAAVPAAPVAPAGPSIDAGAAGAAKKGPGTDGRHVDHTDVAIYLVVDSAGREPAPVVRQLPIVPPAPSVGTPPHDTVRARGSYSLLPVSDGLRIVGTDRVGVLYGVYHFLTLQGWRWFAPGPDGEIRPATQNGIEQLGVTIPEGPVHETPSVPLCRGFDLQFPSMESAALLHWMARNRLSLARNHAKTEQLGRKLGMVYKNGGHIFEAILDPDRVADSGRTFWDEHRTWYGLPESGVRNKATALQTQFCVSQPDLLDFLADDLIERIAGVWSAADLIDVWGFDTWGSCCTCENCRSLGNDTDQLLHMLSHFRNEVNAATATGRLTHDVRLVGCAYEGTSSLQPPRRPIPSNLSNAGDCLTFYPIDRSYAFDFFDERSSTNKHFSEPLEQWLNRSPRPNIIIGEYYNVSKYEDLPLVLTARLTADIPAYTSRGVDGFTYMHPPMVNWSVRTLTQNLYAVLLWDADLDTGRFVEEYFDLWYGPHAATAHQYYTRLEDAWHYIAEWRAWHGSILRSLLAWDGTPPGKPLDVVNHLTDGSADRGAAPVTAGDGSDGIAPTSDSGTDDRTAGDRVAASGQAVAHDRVIAEGRRAVEHLESALSLVDEALAGERERSAQVAGETRGSHGESIQLAENPDQARRLQGISPYQGRLAEDRRAIRYGLDTMRLTVELVAYYDALYRSRGQRSPGGHSETSRPSAAETWSRIEAAADALESYWVPIKYDHPLPGLQSPDGLRRSQLDVVVHRCRIGRRRG